MQSARREKVEKLNDKFRSRKKAREEQKSFSFYTMITIPEFYNNRDVFITGATGFVGKVLIEKLLRSCPGVGRVFLLLRSKRSKTISTRLEEITNTPLFEPLREKNPDVLEKLFAVEGDVGALGLGLTKEALELMKDVSVIFHSAASVRFDDILQSAIILNTRGTHETIKFALSLDQLASFVHISTTYCYPEESFIDEKTYPANGDWERAIEIAENVDTETLECLMQHFTNFSPNSYTFTKGLAEQICEYYRNQIPITIVRPSIVTGSEKEPIRGWCDNFNGPVGLLTACGIGIMRTMYASHKALLDCVAVDVVAKTLIVAGWKCAIDSRKIDNGTESNENSSDRRLPVYNCASLHNMDLDLLVYDGAMMIRRYPFERFVWLPGGGVTLCKFMNYFRIVCFQLLPAVLLDQALKAKGKPPLLMKLQRKIAHASEALKTFIFSEWNFGIENFLNLNKVLMPSDVEDFNMYRSVPDDFEYYFYQIQGARRYLLKEPDSSIPACRRRMLKIMIVDRLLRVILFGFIFYKIFRKYNLFGFDDFVMGTHNETIIEIF